MRELPDWDRYNDRLLQESIATNMFLAVGWLRSISLALYALVGLIIGLAIRHYGWKELFFGAWL
jgi:hypothetical protein